MKRLFLLATTIPLILLLIPHNAFAWDLGSFLNPTGSENNGYWAGQQDAIYDHNNNYQYNPHPMCCHSQLYDDFKNGYDQQWNTYQSQEINQHTNVYVNGNNNYINTAQSSNQGQSQSQEQGPSWTSQCWQCLESDNINGDCSNGCPGQGP